MNPHSVGRPKFESQLCHERLLDDLRSIRHSEPSDYEDKIERNVKIIGYFGMPLRTKVRYK